MLIRFEARNFRSISEPVELSMVAVDRDREAAREVPRLGEHLLTVSAIYGPNASGKSNVLAALAWLRNAVRDSMRAWDDEVPVQPFAFGAGPTELTEFVVESTVHGERFEYVLELDRARVQYEGLFHYPEGKRRRVFEREGLELKLQRGLGALSGTRELLTDRTLALSAARRFGEPLVSDFAIGLLQMQTMGLPSRAMGPRRGMAIGRPMALHTMRWFDSKPRQASLFPDPEELDHGEEDREQALALLRLADLGIDDVLIEEDELRGDTRRTVRLIHRTDAAAAPLDFAAESEGTRTWFALIGPVLTALRSGSVMIFDELDASLHPTLSAELLRLFRDPVTNPRGAQLIFTSHDTSLLGHLNRDEVWLTEKRPDGSTRLGALAEFAGERVRKSQNLETAYLHGRFGGLPQINEAETLRALGLIG